MDDAMLERMTGDAILRQRLEAYAEARLAPDPDAARRIRARVQAAAHRRAERLRAGTSLTVLPDPAGPGHATVGGVRPGRRRSPLRRIAPAAVAATLTVALVAGTTMAARPGGALYGGRLWLETLTLPADPAERAVAEVSRLEERLREVADANATGDAAAAAAALAAYESIIGEAVSAAILVGDPVAAAALEAGVARSLTRLQELVTRVPEAARPALEAAIARAIERSSDAIEAIQTSPPGRAGSEDGGASGGAGGAKGGSGGAGPTSKPTTDPTEKPAKTAKPTAAPAVDTPEPTPRRTPPGKGGNDGQGGANGQGGDDDQGGD